MAFLAGRFRAQAPSHRRMTPLVAAAVALSLAHAQVGFAAGPDAKTASGSSTDIAPKTAILPLVIEGDLPDTDREALTKQLVDGLQRGSFEVVTPDQVDDVIGSDCSKPNCMQKIAAKTGATHIVRATVEVVDRDYTIRVELYDSDGMKVVSSSEGCEICGVADVGGLMETQAATLRTKLDALASGPAAIVISSNPEGADVTLDGEPFGLTPVDKPVIPGDHVIRVSKDGYIAVQEQRTFVEGARENLSYELEKMPNRLPKRPWGWASLGVGIASVGAGAVLIAFHGEDYMRGSKCVGKMDEQDDCEFVHDTKWIGAGLSLAGGALVTLGVAVLLTTSKSQRKKAKIEAAVDKHLQLGAGGVGIRF